MEIRGSVGSLNREIPGAAFLGIVEAHQVRHLLLFPQQQSFTVLRHFLVWHVRCCRDRHSTYLSFCFHNLWLQIYNEQKWSVYNDLKSSEDCKYLLIRGADRCSRDRKLKRLSLRVWLEIQMRKLLPPDRAGKESAECKEITGIT